MSERSALPGNAPRKTFRSAGFFMIRVPRLPLDTVVKIYADSAAAAARGRDWRTGYYESLLRLWQTPGIATAIWAAAPELAGAIGRLPGSSARTQERALTSLAHYVNRMSVRPTPFGLLALIGTGQFGQAGQRGELGGARVSARPDMGWVTMLRRAVTTGDLDPGMVVRTSDLVYHAGDFIGLDLLVGANGEPAGQAGLRRSRPVDLLVSAAREPTEIRALQNAVCRHFTGISGAAVDGLIAEMLRAGLLQPVARRGLVQPAPLEAGSLLPGSRQTQAGALLDSLLASFEAANAEDHVPGLVESVRNQASRPPNGHHPLHLDAVAEWARPPVLPPAVQRLAEDAAHLLAAVGRCHRYPSRLSEYADAFAERFGTAAEVPLFEVVSEISGIGLPRTGDPGHEGGGVAGRELALFRLVTATLTRRTLEAEVTSTVLAELARCSRVPGDSRPAPPGVDIYLRLLGPTETTSRWTGVLTGAAPLGWSFGRFHHVVEPGVTARLRALAAAEQRIVDGSRLVELSYWPPNGRAANVAVRDLVRDWECPVDLPPHGGGGVIRLSDVLVGVRAGILYFKCALSGARLSFTQSSMLDPGHASGLCRFLLDVSISQFRYATGFDWGGLKELPFLPRLRSRDVVLSPAKWQVRSDDLITTAASNAVDTADVRAWAAAWQVPRYVYLVDRDVYTLVDMDSPPCQAELARLLSRPGSAPISLEEALPSPATGFITGTDGRQHAAEVVIPVLCSDGRLEPAGAPVPARTPKPSGPSSATDGLRRATRSMWPGDEWTSAELFVAASLQDAFLLHDISRWVRDLQDAGVADSWFFVRFPLPRPHLRLRLHAATRSEDLPGEIAAWGRRLRSDGRLSQLRLVPYQRESDRYGGQALIGTAERLFCADSAAVLALLAAAEEPGLQFSRTTFAALSLEQLARTMLPETAERIRMSRLLPRSRAGDAEYRRSGADAWHGMSGGPGVGEVLETARSNWGDAPALYARSLSDQGVSPGVCDTAVSAVLHMHCNRLGLSRAEERAAYAIWVHLLRRLIATGAGPSPAGQQLATVPG